MREELMKLIMGSYDRGVADTKAAALEAIEKAVGVALAAERDAVCRIVTGLCISDNNAEEINRAIRSRGQA
jgi:hypothetical protein